MHVVTYFSVKPVIRSAHRFLSVTAYILATGLKPVDGVSVVVVIVIVMVLRC